MVWGREENGRLIISLSGVIDSSNAQQEEKKILKIRQDHPCDSIELDCDKLEYSSSAGLRMILRLIRVTNTVLTSVHPVCTKSLI